MEHLFRLQGVETTMGVNDWGELAISESAVSLPPTRAYSACAESYLTT